MKKFRLAICKGPDCRRNGADAVYAAARVEVERAGLASRCEVYRGGCYGLCHLGPNVVVREDLGGKRDPLSREDYQLMGGPGEAYYWAMTPEKIARVIAGHIAGEQVVTELLGDPSFEADFRRQDDSKPER